MKGERKADYCNGIVVLKLSGGRVKTKRKSSNDKYQSYKGGRRGVAKRVDIKDGVQQLQLLGIYDEKDANSKEAYLKLLTQLRRDSPEPKHSGYIDGMPCNPGDDDNKARPSWTSMIYTETS